MRLLPAKGIYWFMPVLVVALLLGSYSVLKKYLPPSSFSGSREALVLSSVPDEDVVTWGLVKGRFDGATEIRLGNTEQELALSGWRPFVGPILWPLPGYSYPVQKRVFAEIRGPELAESKIVLPVIHSTGDMVPDGKRFPFIELPDGRSSNYLFQFDFDTWQEQWTSYMDAYGYGNVFFPLTHATEAGNGYVWTDDSRWAIDPPEDPDSILVALIYFRWLFPPEWRAKTGAGEYYDLRDTVLSIKLRGKDLSLGNAEVTFWILCNGARWHHVAKPLDVQNGAWIENKLELRDIEDQWHNSWSRNGNRGGLCLDKVESIGVAFRNFPRGEEVKGVFEMDDLNIKR